MAKKIKVTEAMMQEIFDLWNAQKDVCDRMVRHTVFDSKTKARVKTVLSEYPIDLVKSAIVAYGEILAGKEYYFSYVWVRLEYFMQRGFQKFLPEQNPKVKYLDKYGSPSGEVGLNPSDPTSPSPALARKKERFLQWSKATPEERKELAKRWSSEV